jgi:large subunit ribosomal protein L6
MSRVGKQPVSVPENVKVTVQGQTILVEGPKGQMSLTVRPELEVVFEPQKRQIVVTRKGNETRQAKALHGLHRSLIANMVEGITHQFLKRLTITGSGYGARVETGALVLDVGFCHPVKAPIPTGLFVTTPTPRLIEIRGADKQQVGQFAAGVRSIRPPEPYNAKGIKYEDEVIRRKAAKTFVSGG